MSFAIAVAEDPFIPLATAGEVAGRHLEAVDREFPDDRAAAEAWTTHFDALGARHSEIRRASRGWVVVVYDPDGLTVRLYSADDDTEDLTDQPGYAQTV